MDREVIKISCFGDILLHSDYQKIAIEKGPDFVFEKVFPYLNDSDLCFGNMECVLSQIGTPNPEKVCLRGDESYIEALKGAGFDVLSLANNHILDFGFEACENMASKLKKAGIHVLGVGKDIEQSRSFLTIDVKDHRVGFLAYSSRDNGGFDYASNSKPGVAPLDEEYVIEDINKHKNDVNHLIVSLHWGIEYSHYPTPDQISMAHKIIDAGAKIIIGHHPHILQGYEYYNDGIILYSAGNFCSSDLNFEGPNKTYKSELKSFERESAIFELYISKNKIIEKLNLIPLWLNDEGQPEPCNFEKSAGILKKIGERSEVLRMSGFDKYWESMVIKKRVAGPLKLWWKNGSLMDKIKNFKFSQIETLWILFTDYFSMKFSKSSSKWLMFNPRNDKKPKPFCGDEDE